MKNDIPEECEVCKKTLSPMAIQDSYHATYDLGEEGSVLCRKHLDPLRREKWNHK